MLLTELLFQRVKELGATGNYALKPGYVALVSRASTLRALLLACLFPSPDDASLLVEPPAARAGASPGPTRVGIGLLARDGTPYRLLRELGAARALHKYDPQQKRFASLTQDDLEIASFLRVETELSDPDAYARFFMLRSSELPSLAVQVEAPSKNLAHADLSQAQLLKSELEQTHKFEEAQDKLFKVQQRLQELSETGSKLETAERDFNELDAQLSRSLFSPAQIRELTSRAQRAAADHRKHQDQLAELHAAQGQAEQDQPPAPEELHRDPLLWGGFAGGLALDALAFLVGKPWVALFGLIPFGVALVAALRWIDAREQVLQGRALSKRLVDREAALKKAFAEEQAPLRAALKAAGAAAPEELLELFKHRDEVARLREEAKARLENLRAQPGLMEIAAERPKLLEEKVGLEMTVAAQGFARPISEIERDLRRAMGLSHDPLTSIQQLTAAPAEPASSPKALLEQAALLLSLPLADLWSQLAGRLGTYLTALTDKRVVALRLDAQGQLAALSPDGRAGPYSSLPPPLRDLAYTGLRLSLLERVARQKRLPLFVDDTFAPLEPSRRALVHKMLKGISADTQVLHRCAEAPPAGLVDHLVQVP